jgi:hypothetical protein
MPDQTIEVTTANIRRVTLIFYKILSNSQSVDARSIQAKNEVPMQNYSMKHGQNVIIHRPITCNMRQCCQYLKLVLNDLVMDTYLASYNEFMGVVHFCQIQMHSCSTQTFVLVGLCHGHNT